MEVRGRRLDAVGVEGRAVAALAVDELEADEWKAIALQRDEPTDRTRRANWLPTPLGPCRPLPRVYEPDDAIVDGRWELPPIRRTV